MSERCVCDACDDEVDCDEISYVISRIDKDGDPVNGDNWCESCREDDCFWCYATEKWYHDGMFSQSVDKDMNDVCKEAVKAKGWKWVKKGMSGYYAPPENIFTSSTVTIGAATNIGGKPMAAAVDFYWTLPKGKPERVCMLIFDDREEALNSTSVQKIKSRIVEANADAGDPNVLNVYTRLQLIDDKLLAPTYRL